MNDANASFSVGPTGRQRGHKKQVGPVNPRLKTQLSEPKPGNFGASGQTWHKKHSCTVTDRVGADKALRKGGSCATSTYRPAERSAAIELAGRYRVGSLCQIKLLLFLGVEAAHFSNGVKLQSDVIFGVQNPFCLYHAEEKGNKYVY